MRFTQWMAGLSTSFVLATNPLAAANSQVMEQLQVPQCLASQLSSAYKILAENKEFKIIEIPENDMTKLALFADKVHCGRFVNVSHHFNNVHSKQQAAQSLLVKPELKKTTPNQETYDINHMADVTAALVQVDTDNILNTLTHLTNYYNRSATTKRGEDVAKWLQSEFTAMANSYGRKDTTSYFVKTGRYTQPSVVTVIGKDIDAPGIVIGAHMDTLDGRMPGAGDDGSGSSSVMEIARVLLSSKIEFKRPIYIIWYAAEERGLVGSYYVVERFQKKGIPVKAAIQFDMTGFRNDMNDRTMWVYRDYTDPKLSDFVATLIQTYVNVPVDYSECGYGCSDHASWDRIGVPAAFPCETNFEDHNRSIHSEDDTMEKLSPDHMTNFTKLGLAFAIELASE